MPPVGKSLGGNAKVSLRNNVSPQMVMNTGENGEFTFNELAAGLYYVEIVVDAKVYNPVIIELTLKPNEQKTLTIYLEEKQVSFAEKPAKNVTSVSESSQKVPDAARKEYEKATKLIKKGELAAAIAVLQNALNLFPAYQMARNDLGAQYLKLNKLDEAVAEFRQVIEINPQAFNPRLNLGLALVSQKKYAEALPHLAQAISLDSGQPAAHYYRGLALLMTDNYPLAQTEFASALSLGGDAYWSAHYYRAVAYLRNSERDEAARELQAFLAQSSDPDLMAQAKELLAKLK